MRVSKQQLKEIIKEVLTEVENISLLEQDDEDQGKQGRINMKDPIMQKTGWYKDNPDLTIGGVLKKGKDHPAYNDAIKIVDKEKGKATDEPKAEPKKTKIAADPFQSKPDISQQMSDKEKRKNISQDDKDKLSKISQMLDKERKPQQQDEDPETAMDNAAEFLGKLHKQKGWDIEKTFEEIIDAASNPNMVRTILSTPTEKQDPYEKYISALIKNGIENGEISKNPNEIDEFELQNYLETMEADVYDNLADYAYDAIDDQVVASLKKEFKQYDVINKNLMKEVISEADQKFYARDPKGKKLSVFTNKDNFKKAVKGGYEKVDREEAEKELAAKGKASDEPKAEPKTTKIAADPFADKDSNGPDRKFGADDPDDPAYVDEPGSYFAQAGDPFSDDMVGEPTEKLINRAKDPKAALKFMNQIKQNNGTPESISQYVRDRLKDKNVIDARVRKNIQAAAKKVFGQTLDLKGVSMSSAPPQLQPKSDFNEKQQKMADNALKAIERGMWDTSRQGTHRMHMGVRKLMKTGVTPKDFANYLNNNPNLVDKMTDGGKYNDDFIEAISQTMEFEGGREGQDFEKMLNIKSSSNENIKFLLQKEFKQYDVINKNLMRN